MASDGKRVERLVGQIESLLLPAGFSVKGNSIVRSEDGVPLAEFDIEIRGNLGSAEIAWLVECRDRPSSGPAPGAWIEQLAGRRRRFGFNKVTAVSTTGFSDGAVSFAKSEGIDLRSVTELTAQDVRKWFAIEYVNATREHTQFGDMKLFHHTGESQDRQDAFAKALRGRDPKEKNLFSATANVFLSALDICVAATRANHEAIDKLFAAAGGDPVRLTFWIPPDHHIVVETEVGRVRMIRIDTTARRSISKDRAAVANASEYADAGSGRVIAQSAMFNLKLDELSMVFEMHKLAQTDETYFTLRND